MSEKILTISIAAYNAEETLEKAVSSCMVDDESLLEKLDIIIVNDGSKDNTYQVAKKLQEKYQGIRIIDKSNGGYGSTVNAAISVAEGKYFKLLDSDDWYDTSELLSLLHQLEEDDSDMIVTNYTEVRQQGNNVIIYREKKEICSNPNNLKEHFSMHAVMYRTELLKRNNIKLQEGILYTDTEFVAYPLMFVKTVAFYPYNIYQYSLYGEGQSVSINSRINHINDAEAIVINLEKYIKNISENVNINYIVMNKMADACKFYINGLLLANNIEAKEKIKEFDTYINNNWNYVYQEYSNKIIKLLRSTNYKWYGLCGWILKKTLK